jgi:hypothetical protein
MEHILAAESIGNEGKANLYLNIYTKAKAEAATAKRGRTIKEKADAPDQADWPNSRKLVKQGGLFFAVKGINSFLNMGLPPYFDKNMKELKGTIPITIFNKRWQDAAMIHHSETQQHARESLALQGKLAQLLPVDMQSRKHHLICTQSTLGCTVTVHDAQSLRTTSET